MAHQHSRRPGGSSHHQQHLEQRKTEEDVVIVGDRSGVYEVSRFVSRGIPVIRYPTRSVRSKRTTYHLLLKHRTVHSVRQLPQNNLVPLLLVPTFTRRTILFRLLVPLFLLVDEPMTTGLIKRLPSSSKPIIIP